jgi:uncharacterized protein (DUF1499 family)
MEQNEKTLKSILLVLVVSLVAGLAWVRLAPSDLARWHIDPRGSPANEYPPSPAPGPEAVVAIEGGARAAMRTTETPEAILERLDRIVMATPGTSRLAGSPAEGRITWITRSRLIGFPDYTTAAASVTDVGSRLDILARQRFGMRDLGVNAARLRDWLGQLAP